MLEALNITHENLLHARSDSDLLETLRITHEVLCALRDSDVLGVFLQLPTTEQADFLRLIGSTDDRESRHHRTGTFVSALEESPLAGEVPTPGKTEPADVGDAIVLDKADD